jgi:hypothetical protein
VASGEIENFYRKSPAAVSIGYENEVVPVDYPGNLGTTGV